MAGLSRTAPDRFQPHFVVDWRARSDLNCLFTDESDQSKQVEKFIKRNQNNTSIMTALFTRFPDELDRTTNYVHLLEKIDAPAVHALVAGRLAEQGQLILLDQLCPERRGLVVSHLSPEKRYMFGWVVADHLALPAFDEYPLSRSFERQWLSHESWLIFMNEEACTDWMRGYINRIQDCTLPLFKKLPLWWVSYDEKLASATARALSTELSTSEIMAYLDIEEGVVITESQHLQLWKFIIECNQLQGVRSLENWLPHIQRLQTIHPACDQVSLVHIVLLDRYNEHQIDSLLEDFSQTEKTRLLEGLTAAKSCELGGYLHRAGRYELALEIYEQLPNHHEDHHEEFLCSLLDYPQRDTEDLQTEAWWWGETLSSIDDIAAIAHLFSFLLSDEALGFENSEQVSDEAKQQFFELMLLLPALSQFNQIEEPQLERLHQLVVFNGPNAWKAVARGFHIAGTSPRHTNRNDYGMRWRQRRKVLSLALPLLPADTYDFVFPEEIRTNFYKDISTYVRGTEVTVLDDLKIIFECCPPKPTDILCNYPSLYDENQHVLLALMLHHCRRGIALTGSLEHPVFAQQETIECERSDIGILAELPDEMLLSVASFLDRPTLRAFNETNKYLHLLTNESALWGRFARSAHFSDVETDSWRLHLIGTAQSFNKELAVLVEQENFNFICLNIDALVSGRGESTWPWILAFCLNPGQRDRAKEAMRSKVVFNGEQERHWLLLSESSREITFESLAPWLMNPSSYPLLLAQARFEPLLLERLFNEFFPSECVPGCNSVKPWLGYLLGLYSVTGDNLELVHELLDQHEDQEDTALVNIVRSVRRGIRVNPTLSEIETTQLEP